MDQAKKARLEAGGIRVDDALDRFMGNEAMLERYWEKFLNDKSYATLRNAIAAHDREAAAMAAHTLKSVCGTIGCVAMQELVLRQESLLRAGQWEEAVSMMPELSRAYEDACGVIRG